MSVRKIFGRRISSGDWIRMAAAWRQAPTLPARFHSSTQVGRWVAVAWLGMADVRAEPSFYTARVAPILDQHCVVCHGDEKQKAGLRLDSFEHVLRGAKSGEVVKPGDAKASELYRRITLPKDDEEVMPSDGKSLLAPDEIKIIELWLTAGASSTEKLSAFPHAPAPKPRRAETVALAPDWRPFAKQIQAVERETGVRIVPRSQVPTDGLVLRTASMASRCDDAALGKLSPFAALIVEAELARTKITDAGLVALGRWENLRTADLTRTAVTSGGLGALKNLQKLESLNLTNTAVDDEGVKLLKAMPALKRIWVFGTKVTAQTPDGRVAGK